MGFFNAKRDRFTREQQLAAKPIQLIDAKLTETSSGAKLQVPVKPRRLAGLLLRLPKGTTKTFELDPLGLLVWQSCDGKTSVQQIIRKLAKRYNLNLREAEVPTLTFLSTLARKGLIGLEIERRVRTADHD